MAQFFGIDPETGYKLFVVPPSTLRLELPKCPCCGGEGLLSHSTKFGGKHVCKECGDKWAAYVSARSRLNCRSSHRVVLNHLERINYWLAIKEAGGLAPARIEQDMESVQNYVSFYGITDEPKNEPEYVQGQCYYCGAADMVLDGASRPRCPDCTSRYKRYRYLQTHLGTLTIDECEEFGFILSDYVDLMRKGYWAPDVPKYRQKIKERMNELV